MDPSRVPFRVLFVCTGNICRSPMAEGVLAKLVSDGDLAGRIEVDSAGLWTMFAGSPPDATARRVARDHGVDLSSQRARAVCAQDYRAFDLISCMAREHRDAMWQRAEESSRERIRMFTEWLPDGAEQDVPDPYQSGRTEFERTFRIVEAGCRALYEELRSGLV